MNYAEDDKRGEDAEAPAELNEGSLESEEEEDELLGSPEAEEKWE